jgi:predicted metalloprotease
MAKGSKGAGSNGVGSVLVVVGLLLLMVHAMIIAEDVQAVIEDPNKENKPGEILKLAIDLSRYLP